MAYKSKFNGTQIDTLLEKTQELSDLHEAGQLGGGSEKEELAKEIGATHKHTITLSAEVKQYNVIMKIRCITYTADPTPLTPTTMRQLMASGDGTCFNGYYAGSQGGIVGISDAIWCLKKGENGLGSLLVTTGRVVINHNFVKSIDFTNQTAVNEFFNTFEPTTIDVQDLIDGIGATFTDTVTEL